MRQSIGRRNGRRMGRRIALASVAFAIALLAASRPAPAEPGYFGLSAPVNNAAITFDTSFTWGVSSNATEYYVEIKPTSGSPWESIAVGSTTSWKPAWGPDLLDLMAGREIEWRVRACHPAEPDPAKRCRYNNHTGFGTPTPRVARVPLFPAILKSPASGTVTGTLPQFEWIGAIQGVTYHLKVNGYLKACEESASQTSCTLKEPLVPGNHQWWVEQCIQLGSGTVCGEPPQFTKNTAPNQRVHLLSVQGRGGGRTGR